MGCGPSQSGSNPQGQSPRRPKDLLAPPSSSFPSRENTDDQSKASRAEGQVSQTDDISIDENDPPKGPRRFPSVPTVPSTEASTNRSDQTPRGFVDRSRVTIATAVTGSVSMGGGNIYINDSSPANYPDIPITRGETPEPTLPPEGSHLVSGSQSQLLDLEPGYEPGAAAMAEEDEPLLHQATGVSSGSTSTKDTLIAIPMQPNQRNQSDFSFSGTDGPALQTAGLQSMPITERERDQIRMRIESARFGYDAQISHLRTEYGDSNVDTVLQDMPEWPERPLQLQLRDTLTVDYPRERGSNNLSQPDAWTNPIFVPSLPPTPNNANASASMMSMSYGSERPRISRRSMAGPSGSRMDRSRSGHHRANTAPMPGYSYGSTRPSVRRSIALDHIAASVIHSQFQLPPDADNIGTIPEDEDEDEQDAVIVDATHPDDVPAPAAGPNLESFQQAARDNDNWDGDNLNV